MTLELSPGGRRYGYHKDVPDARDLKGTSLPSATAPTASNLSLMGPVLDQGQEGSCTAHAAVGDREFLHWKEIAAKGGTIEVGSEGLYSPAFNYFVERQLDAGWTGTGPFLADPGDVGSMGRTSCMALNKFGCALRADMPYVAGDFATPPTAEQLAAALKWATGQYHSLASVDEMKACLASGYNFRIGFTVYSSFESIGSDGLWTPSKSESVLGGHEVLAVGYDDSVNGGSFLVRNSWGAGWGASGNFWMRYVDAADPDVLQDAWIQHLGKWS